MFNRDKGVSEVFNRNDEYHDDQAEGEANDEATVPTLAYPDGFHGQNESSEAERPGLDQLAGEDGRELIVGRQIVLKCEIQSCDRLVVEGQVEASMKDCHEIEIAETGTFKGHGEFDRADVSGVYEGEFTVREHLVLRATGRIIGTVRFGELEIERGGQIIGNVQVFGDDPAEERDTRATGLEPETLSLGSIPGATASD